MASRQTKNKSIFVSDSPWVDFRILCRYYADCVEASELPSEILPMKEENARFVSFRPPPRWLDPDGPHNFDVSLSDFRKRAFCATLATHEAYKEEIYVGYPCWMVHTKSETVEKRVKKLQEKTKKKKVKIPGLNAEVRARQIDWFIAPVFIIPVKTEIDGADNLHGVLDLSRAKFNGKRLERELSPEVYRRILSFYDTENNQLDFKAILSYLSAVTGADYNPDMPGTSLVTESGLQNVAVLGVGLGLRYSQTLRRELLAISDESDEVLDSTALAYVFRKPVKECPSYDLGKATIPVDFLPSNQQQTYALLDALNKPCTKIQGPPGTGKSYTAVNLLMNLAYQGKSALFTSKNRKAIHAIDQEVHDIVAGKGDKAGVGLDLIQFCVSDDDTSLRQSWYQADLDRMRSAAEDLTDATRSSRMIIEQRMEEATEEFRRVWQLLERRLRQTKNLERNESLLYQRRALLKSFDIRDGAIDDDAVRLLGKLYLERPSCWWKRLLYWLMRRQHIADEAEKRLRRQFPKVRAVGTVPFRKRISRIIRVKQLAEGYDRRCNTAMEKVRELPPYADIFRDMTTAVKRIEDVAVTALQLRVAKRTKSLSADLLKKVQQQCLQIQNSGLPFLSALIDPDIQETSREAFKEFTRFYPIWVSTILSLTRASPCVAGVFDHLIVDEAGQCEIPPLIPALFRAKSVTVIGDPEQFKPVIDLPAAKHFHLQRINGLEDQRLAEFDYLEKTSFSVVPSPITLLQEHRRCSKAIADYVSETFYEGDLYPIQSTADGRPDPRLDFPRYMGYKSALEWHHVENSREGEFCEVEHILDAILKNRNDITDGITIGVISPLRAVVNALKIRLRPYYGKFHKEVFSEADVNTTYSFQGGSRGLIIFVVGLTSPMAPGESWYITAPENKNIYNVAISRAKFCCIVVGDRNLAQQCSLSALRNLASPQKHRGGNRPESIGCGEPILQAALERIGLHPIPQYPLLYRKLDLALEDSKIDVEVDGAAYHLNSRGCRNQDDYFRDYQVSLVGWYPYRVWHRDVIDDPDGIAKEILALHSKRLHELQPESETD